MTSMQLMTIEHLGCYGREIGLKCFSNFVHNALVLCHNIALNISDILTIVYIALLCV